MPIVTGRIDHYGAVVAVLVGVSRAREDRLRGHNLAPPAPVPLRLVIDTGSYATGLTSEALARLEIGPVAQNYVHTSLSERPHLAELFDVTITLASGASHVVVPDVRVLSSPSCGLKDPTNGILGRDILNRCAFQYFGPHQYFELAIS